ncbi:MAG: alpha/beta hydrolase [bacterium]|nr:alpha/beta hydrolase [bacterium]
MVRWFLLAILLLIGIGFAVAGSGYSSWRTEHLAALEQGSRVVSTEKGPIEVRSFGDSGPTMLFVHGTPGGYDQISLARAEALTGGGIRVLSMSRPGYLRTPIEVGRTPAEQADAYAALLDAEGIASVAVLGVSGGGPSSIAFAARHPDRIWALVALEAVSRTLPSNAVELVSGSDFLAWLMARLWFADPAWAVEMMVPNPENAQRILDDEGKVEEIRGLIEGTLPPSLRKVGSENDLEQFEALDDLPVSGIRAPTLIVHGTQDSSVPFGHGEFLHAAVVGSEFQIVEDGDHMMVISHQEEIDARVSGFLMAHAPRH